MSIYIDTSSQNSIRSLSELASDLFNGHNEVPYFRYQIGKYLKNWHRVKVDDEAVYCIDGTTLFRGRIKFIKSMAFRPKWIPDNEMFKMFVDFARTNSRGCFSREWHLTMSKQHSKTIDTYPQRWSFAVFATIEPLTFYQESIMRLMDKVDSYNELQSVLDSNGNVTQASALND